ncbi:MAG: InlB B-repeat-containing protein, partial [Luteolibacter sp.]
QQAYLKAANTEASDSFGGSVSISRDDILVGARLEDSNATGINGNQSDNSAQSSGAAYLFVRNADIWSQQAYLKASNTGGLAGNYSDTFGCSVAVSQGTGVIGALGESSSAIGVNGDQFDNSAWGSGAAYIFPIGDYLLSVSGENGSVQGAGMYDEGAIANLVATPNLGYIFTGWYGDASGTNNPLPVLMDSDKTITAIFTLDTSDPDDDGLTTYQEKVLFGTSPIVGDTDADGLNDGYEVGVGRFQIISGSFTWADAKADAEARSGSLASFVSAGEWDVAMAGLGPDPFAMFTGLWIGLTDSVTEGTWKWTTNEPFSFNRWAPGQPDNASGADHVEISGGFGVLPGYWLDTPGAASRDGYLLESGITTSPLVSDMDADGLNDGQEREAGTNPLVGDTDGDGLSDSVEVLMTKTNPLRIDSDSDGIADANEDTDGDGLPNLEEVNVHRTNPSKADTDGDDLSDLEELGRGRFQLVSGSFTWAEAKADSVSRGGHLAGFPTQTIYNEAMTAIGAIALNNVTGVWIGASDSVFEGTWRWSSGKLVSYNRWGSGQPDNASGADVAEINGGFGTYPGFWVDTPAAARRDGYIFEATFPTDPTLLDSDGDGLNDGQEKANGTPPWWGDADGDGFLDGGEVEFGGDPLSASVAPEFKARVVSGETAASVEFRFLAQQGFIHSVEVSTNLGTWNTIETNITGQGGVVTRSYSIENQPKRYFRVRKN